MSAGSALHRGKRDTGIERHQASVVRDAILPTFGFNQRRGMKKSETVSVVLENVKLGDLPEAWRKHLKAGAEERLTVTIAKRPSRASASRPRASKRPNASFGMWADRVHIDPAAYVRALRRPRLAR
jgi:hypothetical protein